MDARTLRTDLKLALLAVAFGTSSVSWDACAAVASATASATVVAPIAITKGADLSFGRFATGAGGTVTISTSGERTASGVVLYAGSGSAAAKFVVTGDQGASYSITHSGSATLTRTAGPETMSLTKFSALTAANATAGTASSGALAGGTQSIYLGGTLAVAPDQAAGDYTGVVSVAVEYN